MVNNEPPIDRGWAWVITAGLFLKNFVNGGFINSYGVFFSAFSERFGRSASETQFVRSARAISATLVGPFSTVLSERLSERVVVIGGALCVTLGFVLAFFAGSLEFLIFTFGVLNGAGVSLIDGPSNVSLGRYFDKKRGRANSLTFVGSALGQITVPPLVALLLSTYTLRGAMLIYGGFAFNIVITGMLMRPLSFYKKKQGDTTQLQNNHARGDLDFPKEGDLDLFLYSSQIDNVSGCDDLQEWDKKPSEPIKRRQKVEPCFKGTAVTCSKLDASVGNSVSRSMKSLAEGVMEPSSNFPQSPLVVGAHRNSQTLAGVSRRKKWWSVVIQFVKDIFDPRVLTNPLYILFLITTAIFLATNGNQLTFIVPRAQEIGISRDMAAVLVSVIGGCDILGRLLLGILADIEMLPSHLVMSVGVLISSISMFAIPSTNNYVQMIGVSVIFGIFGSSSVILNLPVMVDFVGTDLLPKAVGMAILFYGTTDFMFSPLLGFVKDSSGSYDTVFYVTASMQAFASFLMIAMAPLARKRLRRGQKHQQNMKISAEIECIENNVEENKSDIEV